MSNEPVGVLIVGAGASGAAFAWRIADVGVSVLCLEQGPWMKQSDYPSNNLDWESRSMAEFATSPNVRKLPADYPVNEQDSAISPLMFNAVGGSTILWAGHFPRFTPGDFRVKTEDGLADDWPIDYQTLEPFFAINDRMMGVSGLAGDPAYPYHEPPLPPLPLGKTGNVVATGFEKLGWHWWPSDSHHLPRVRGPRTLHQPGHVPQRLRAGGESQRGHHLLARGSAEGRAGPCQLPRSRDHGARRWDGGRCSVLR